MSLNILILTDFSEAANAAASYALNLPAEEANFFLLHVGDLEDQKLVDFTQKLIQNPKASGHKFHAIRSTDNLINATRKTVEEKKIELIIMGVSEKSFSDLKGLGKNSYDVIKKVKCPVLTVPKNFKFKPWESIYFPIDTRLPMPESRLDLLKKLPLNSKSNFEVWEYSCRENTAEKNTPPQAFSHNFGDYKTSFKKAEDSPEFIMDFWKKANKSASLILLMARHLKISEALLLRPSEKVYLRQKLPVLILHD